MQQFRIVIDTDNDAFGTSHSSRCREVKRILRRALAELEVGTIDPSDRRTLRDNNGNTIGCAEFVEIDD